MVRNDTPWIVDGIEVSASLEGFGGEHIQTVATDVPVRYVRPGEPAPFAVASTVRRDAIALVRWTTAYRCISPSQAALRKMEIALGRFLSGARAPDGAAVTLLAGDEERLGALREVAWGSVRSWGERPIRKPAVVALWLSADGRALSLVRARVFAPAGGRKAAAAKLHPGDLVEFAVSVPDSIVGTGVGRPALALWGSPS